MLNCPNCGAPVQSDICQYCGSVFLDWACFDMNRPTFVKIRDHIMSKICQLELSTNENRKKVTT